MSCMALCNSLGSKFNRSVSCCNNWAAWEFRALALLGACGVTWDVEGLGATEELVGWIEDADRGTVVCTMEVE